MLRTAFRFERLWKISAEIYNEHHFLVGRHRFDNLTLQAGKARFDAWHDFLQFVASREGVARGGRVRVIVGEQLVNQVDIALIVDLREIPGCQRDVFLALCRIAAGETGNHGEAKADQYDFHGIGGVNNCCFTVAEGWGGRLLKNSAIRGFVSNDSLSINSLSIKGGLQAWAGWRKTQLADGATPELPTGTVGRMKAFRLTELLLYDTALAPARPISGASTATP